MQAIGQPFTEYVVMGGGSSIALLGLSVPASMAMGIAALWGAVLIALMWLVDKRWREFQVNHAAHPTD